MHSLLGTVWIHKTNKESNTPVHFILHFFLPQYLYRGWSKLLPSPFSLEKGASYNVMAINLCRYKRNGGKYWKNFVNTKGDEWAKMNLDWFNAFPNQDRLVVFYEELLAKPLQVLKNVLDFLGIPVTDENLQCVLDKKEGIYKRSKKKLGIEVFSNSMKSFLQEKQRNVYFILKNGTMDAKI